MLDFFTTLRKLPENIMEHIRLHLANPDTTVILSLLAIITGLLSGGAIVLFRLQLERLQLSFLAQAEAYESLSWYLRFLLPLLGAMFLGVLFHLLLPRQRQVGPVHVIERLQYHQGRMPLTNALAQFFGALISLVSGHSLGREGPGIHIGAYAGSVLGQTLQLPHNSMRTLLACGSAAAIGASFNTPLAGIIFAMEVIVKEYTVTSLIPIILATIAGTLVSISFFGAEVAFNIADPSLFEIDEERIHEVPLILLMGVLIGGLAAAFNFSAISITTRLANYEWSVYTRFTFAGFITGCVAIWVPEVMGIGYDTVQQSLDSSTENTLLLAVLLILCAKFIVTVACVSAGLPGGTIGPLMFLGAMMGAVSAAFGNLFITLNAMHSGFYALLGMGAMFGASLQAPLAALIAVMEMTHSSEVILPAMLAIISATLTSKVIFRSKPLFRALLLARGLDHAASPVMQRLRSIGAVSVLDRNFTLCAQHLDYETANVLIQENPHWLLITDTSRKPLFLLRAWDLRSFLEGHKQVKTINLQEIPGRRLQLSSLPTRSTLQEALERLNETNAEALYVQRQSGGRIYGILTRGQVERTYL